VVGSPGRGGGSFLPERGGEWGSWWVWSSPGGIIPYGVKTRGDKVGKLLGFYGEQDGAGRQVVPGVEGGGSWLRAVTLGATRRGNDVGGPEVVRGVEGGGTPTPFRPSPTCLIASWCLRGCGPKGGARVSAVVRPEGGEVGGARLGPLLRSGRQWGLAIPRSFATLRAGLRFGRDDTLGVGMRVWRSGLGDGGRRPIEDERTEGR
jgi:hypothetical protein